MDERKESRETSREAGFEPSSVSVEAYSMPVQRVPSPSARVVRRTATGASGQLSDSEKDGPATMSKVGKNIPSATCKNCASEQKAKGRDPRQMILLGGTTQNKKLKVLACPHCDGDTIHVRKA